MMPKSLTIAAMVTGLTITPVCAQQMPAGLPANKAREAGPSLAMAMAAANKAVAACAANGYKVTVLVADSEGVPVVLASADGVPAFTQQVAMMKAATTLRYRVPSGDVEARMKTDAKLAAEIAADPKIKLVRRGALPILKDGAIVGAIAVSGAPGGEKDEACARVAIGTTG